MRYMNGGNQLIDKIEIKLKNRNTGELYPIYIDACGVNIMLYAYPHVSVFSTQDTKSVGKGNQ